MRRSADVVPMVGDRLNVGVRIRLKLLARLSLVTSALNDVIQVRNHARRAERLAMIIEVDSPGIASTFREDLKFLARGVVAPDRSVDRGSLTARRARLADPRMRKDAVAAVE